MLRIKDSFSIEELQTRYGMKPKYDEDTGEIYAYSFRGEKIRCDDRLLPVHYELSSYHYESDFVEQILIKLAKDNLLEIEKMKFN